MRFLHRILHRSPLRTVRQDTLRGHSQQVLCFGFSPNGNLLLSGGASPVFILILCLNKIEPHYQA